jgi:hypothetical protein
MGARKLLVGMQEVKEMEGLVAGVLHGALGTHGIWAFD